MTLQTFIRGLLMPDLAFKTLAYARAVTDHRGLPQLMRTTHFAEAEIVWQGAHWLLSMPLSPAALFRVERTATALQRLNTPWLTEYRILTAELSGKYDLVLQRLPEGITFEEALLREPHERLLSGVDALEKGLDALNFTHNNLKPANLRWTGERFIPLRYHDARFNGGSDREAFVSLRQRIEQSADTACASDVACFYSAQRRLTGHNWISHVFEGLVCVEDESGYGYVDTDNNPVIASQYLWADDFHEGRAEVETATGMGLIDRQGNYVIEPVQEIVDYDPVESVVHVRQEGSWSLYDYLGRKIEEKQQI